MTRKQKTPINKDDLDELILKTNKEAQKIKQLDQLIDKMPEGKAKIKYTEELLEMIDEYYLKTEQLKEMASQFIEEEKERTGITPLIYVKLVKGLSKK